VKPEDRGKSGLTALRSAKLKTALVEEHFARGPRCLRSASLEAKEKSSVLTGFTGSFGSLLLET
jgi:hypothetical protein